MSAAQGIVQAGIGWSSARSSLTLPGVTNIASGLTLATGVPYFIAASKNPATTNFVAKNLNNGSVLSAAVANANSASAPSGGSTVGAAPGFGSATGNELCGNVRPVLHVHAGASGLGRRHLGLLVSALGAVLAGLARPGRDSPSSGSAIHDGRRAFGIYLMSWMRGPALGGLSTDIIPADRRTVWQPGVTYNGGITNRTTVFTTLTPIGGGSDDTAAIQAACNACPAGQVVAFSAGTFIVNSTIDLTNCPNITLRGAGPGTGATGGNLANDSASVLVGGGTGTFLNKANRLTDTSNIIINIGHGFQDFLTSINFAADVAVGARSCTVVSSPGVSVGDFVFIDEDTTNEPDVFWGLTNQPPGNPHRGDFGRLGRSLTQVMRVTAVSGNTVTFETPFHHSFTVANNAQLTPYSVAPQFTRA